MPREEELRMFHRLQFWRRMSIALGISVLALFAGLLGAAKAVTESDRSGLELRYYRQLPVEIMRQPAVKKIDNLTRA